MEDIIEDPILDIDVPDAKNPLAVVEYIDDIYSYYRKMEVSIHQICLLWQNFVRQVTYVDMEI